MRTIAWHLTLLLLAVVRPEAADATTHVDLQGRFSRPVDGSLVVWIDGTYVGYTFEALDTLSVDAGRFDASLTLDGPRMVYLQWNDAARMPVFAEAGRIDVTLDPEGGSPVEVQGSAAHALLESLEFTRQQYRANVERVADEVDALGSSNTAARLVKQAQLEAARATVEQFLLTWVAAHRDSPVAPFVATRYLIESLDLPRLEPLLALFPRELSASPYVKQLQERRQRLQDARIGAECPAFTLPTPDGSNVSVSDLRGKVVLLDFWASWCGPCRVQNPGLIALYRTFDRTDFEIVGIGLEFDRKRWIAAIDEDELPWIQLSDVSGFDVAPARLFAIRALPANVLLGRDGTIVGKDLHGEALRTAVEAAIGG